MQGLNLGGLTFHRSGVVTPISAVLLSQAWGLRLYEGPSNVPVSARRHAVQRLTSTAARTALASWSCNQNVTRLPHRFMNDCHERPGPNGSVLNFDVGSVVHDFTGTVSPALNADGSGTATMPSRPTIFKNTNYQHRPLSTRSPRSRT